MNKSMGKVVDYLIKYCLDTECYLCPFRADEGEGCKLAAPERWTIADMTKNIYNALTSYCFSTVCSYCPFRLYGSGDDSNCCGLGYPLHWEYISEGGEHDERND